MDDLLDTRKTIIQHIRSAARQNQQDYLTYENFRRISGVPMSRVLKHFDSWTEACAAAHVKCGEASPSNIAPNFSRGKLYALSEVKRIARKLGADCLSKSQFDKNREGVSACTAAKLWGGWASITQAAGLRRHPKYKLEIPLSKLADEFLLVVNEIEKVPTVHQLVRRSVHGMNTFTRKFGGYRKFKVEAIKHLLAKDGVPEQTAAYLSGHLKQLTGNDDNSPKPAPAHLKGRSLGFRAFAYAPTYELEVHTLFGNVAQELGFELVAQRSKFPDCEARRLVNKRRGRYKKCLIEFELRSSDYKYHKHPLHGCDLIVCWLHDWNDCPIEVLELQSEIRKLPGWR